MAAALRLAIVNLTTNVITMVAESPGFRGIQTPEDGQGIAVIDAYESVSKLHSEDIIGKFKWDPETLDFIPI